MKGQWPTCPVRCSSGWGSCGRQTWPPRRRLQERDGGSFGECLVRLGFVDEEQLAEFYKSRLMITRVPDHQLVDVHKNVLALVPADMAAEFRVLPLDVDGDGLVLAMADPTDNHAVDEMAFFADRFIVRVVATESAIRDGIERHYGVRFTSPRAERSRGRTRGAAGGTTARPVDGGAAGARAQPVAATARAQERARGRRPSRPRRRSKSRSCS